MSYRTNRGALSGVVFEPRRIRIFVRQPLLEISVDFQKSRTRSLKSQAEGTFLGDQMNPKITLTTINPMKVYET